MSRSSVEDTFLPAATVALESRAALADQRLLQRGPHEPHRIARARDVPGLIEAVRVDVLGVAQAELPGLRIHERDEAGDRAAADVEASAIAASFALGTSAPIAEVAHRDPLAGAQEERRLADPGGRLRHGDDVVGRACSSATSTVISFVMLATGRGCQRRALDEHSTVVRRLGVVRRGLEPGCAGVPRQARQSRSAARDASQRINVCTRRAG